MQLEIINIGKNIIGDNYVENNIFFNNLPYMANENSHPMQYFFVW
jgi:hypothetical protein